MNLTVQQLIDLTKNDVGQTDSQKLDTGVMIVKASLTQREVQTDLMPLLGMKLFTKSAILTTNNPVVPTDLRPEANSIIDMKASIGTRATITGNIGTVSNVPVQAIITALQPGTAGNGWAFTWGSASVGTRGITINTTAKTVLITWQGDGEQGTNTLAEVVALIAADLYLTANFTITLGLGQTGTLLFNSPKTTLTTATGSATGYYPCKEWTIEEENQNQEDSYKAPSVTQPKYIRRGDSSGTQKLFFYPTTINYSTIYYRYNLAELTAVTDLLTIPTIYEPLLYKKFLVNIYIVLKAQTESEEAKADYQTKMKNLFDSYQMELASFVQEKTRLQSNNPQK